MMLLEDQRTDDIRDALESITCLIHYARRGWVTITPGATPAEPTVLDYSEACPADQRGQASASLLVGLAGLETYVHQGGKKPATLLDLIAWAERTARVFREELARRALD